MVTLRIRRNLFSLATSQLFLSNRHFNSRLLYSSKQYSSSDTKSDDFSSSSSSSAYYREFNRKRYEQKRSRVESDEQTMGFQQLNHYQRLNIANDANVDDIKSAYYSLSKIYHPDVAGDNVKAAEHFRLATESYDILRDQSRRDEYDRELKLHKSSLDVVEPMSWMHSEYPNEQSNPAFRAGFNPHHVIFKCKEDDALELEKLRNPKKFQAGVFKPEFGDTSRRNRYNSLGVRLRDFQSNTKRNKDDFYKYHLYAGMVREYGETSNPQFSDKPKTSFNYRTELNSILGLGTLIVIGVVFIICYLFNFGVAEFLDRKLAALMEDEKLKKKAKSQ